MRISFNAFMDEIRGHNVVGVIATARSTDAFDMERAACYREEGSIKLANHNRCLSVELDIILYIDRTECRNGITEYEISTINSIITLDALGREGRA